MYMLVLPTFSEKSKTAPTDVVATSDLGPVDLGGDLLDVCFFLYETNVV